MKLAAIYNIWDGVELLKGSIDCIKDHVDVVIFVYQRTSNFGEAYDPFSVMKNSMDSLSMKHEYSCIEYLPANMGGAFNEKEKRNAGLDIARKMNCTHFVHFDCDEYYKNFGEAKQMYIDSGKEGSVCKLFTYFKDPTFRFANADNYFVPFIHKLKDDSVAGGKNYPFYVDPTRKINEIDVIELPIFMHHFSYIRKNIERKCRNSSAKNNILKSSVLKDYYSEGILQNPEGYYVEFFDQKLTVVDNYFNINVFN